MKLYPAMDLLGGKVVRLRKGRYDEVTVYSDDPRTTLTEFVRLGVERIHMVDLDGARDGAPTQSELIRDLLVATRARVQIGGGIRTMAQLEAYSRAGAERFVLGTAAVKNPEFARSACAEFNVVIAVDALDGMVATEGWTQGTTISAYELASRAQDMGARAVLYTDISRDGTGDGPNVVATEALARAVPGLEVIASGGIGSLADLEALAASGVIGGCVVGRALYEGTFKLEDALRAVADRART